MSAECIHHQEGPLYHSYEFCCCGEVLTTRHGERFNYCPFCGEGVSMTHPAGMRWF